MKDFTTQDFTASPMNDYTIIVFQLELVDFNGNPYERSHIDQDYVRGTLTQIDGFDQWDGKYVEISAYTAGSSVSLRHTSLLDQEINTSGWLKVLRRDAESIKELLIAALERAKRTAGWEGYGIHVATPQGCNSNPGQISATQIKCLGELDMKRLYNSIR